MLSALQLARQGVHVKIIDRAEGVAAHGYVCALHRRALQCLERVQLADVLMKEGRRINTVAFYRGNRRQSEIRFRSAPHELPYLLTLPQSILEGSLEDALLSQANLPIQWGHRLASLSTDERQVLAGVNELGLTSKGYSVPHLDQVVRRSCGVEASFLVGADGVDSVVRKRLGIESRQLGEPARFAFFDFTHSGTLPDEMRVVFDEALTSCLWPLPHGAARWLFQLPGHPTSEEHRAKDRDPVMLDSEDDPQGAPQILGRLIRERAPWFDVPIQEILWHRTLTFEHRLAEKFGQGRCWLAGSAAHQSCPVGMQGVNVGLSEASQLADILTAILRQGAPMDLLAEYEGSRQSEWRQLLGLTGQPRPGPQVAPWVRQQYDRLLACLPASREDLKPLTDQLAVDLAAAD
jgi:NADPH-dependent dioxygenase